MPSSVTISPFTLTNPALIKVSASRLEQIPALAIYLLSLIPSFGVAFADLSFRLEGLEIFFIFKDLVSTPLISSISKLSIFLFLDLGFSNLGLEIFFFKYSGPSKYFDALSYFFP